MSGASIAQNLGRSSSWPVTRIALAWCPQRQPLQGAGDLSVLSSEGVDRLVPGALPHLGAWLSMLPIWANAWLGMGLGSKSLA